MSDVGYNVGCGLCRDAETEHSHRARAELTSALRACETTEEEWSTSWTLPFWIFAVVWLLALTAAFTIGVAVRSLLS